MVRCISCSCLTKFLIRAIENEVEYFIRKLIENKIFTLEYGETKKLIANFSPKSLIMLDLIL